MALCAATHVPAQLLVAVSVACSAVVAGLPNIVGGPLRRRATDEVVS